MQADLKTKIVDRSISAILRDRLFLFAYLIKTISPASTESNHSRPFFFFFLNKYI